MATKLGYFLLVVLWTMSLDMGVDAGDLSTIDDTFPLVMKLSILSWRNDTGHWVSKVNLQHSGNVGEKDDPWSVEVQQSNKQVDQFKNFVVIDITLTSPNDLKNNNEDNMKVILQLAKYTLHSTYATWHEAKKICEQHHSRLAVLHSEQEAETIREIFKMWKTNEKENYQRNTAHIGFNDLEHEGHYVTLEGKTLKESGYEKWKPGNPNLDFHEDCGGIDRNGLLHDVGCDHRLAFICEAI